ncbi:hypothetical protein RHMOL_Rhmol04G0275600 [Rhododendron molle]|uniref:Uncharacterized protein n=1 Tax=Rhododendron molle TaxID=49168 RepID=A0ACC0P4T7_RHOML|nr:hypothetical protein RHMOL_Rhmol04G0275600 [Rhododendron molle]
MKVEDSEIKSTGVGVTESQFLTYVKEGLQELSKDFTRPNIISSPAEKKPQVFNVRNTTYTGSEELATVKATFKKLFSFLVDRKLQADEPISCNWAECVFDASPLTTKELGLADLKPAPAMLDDDRAQLKDPTEEKKLWTP